MAKPVVYKPEPADPRKDLTRRLAEAPHEHAEAMLVLWDTLQAAHDQGILDLANGLMSGRDIVAAEFAKAAKQQESVQAIRNAISVVRVLASINPDVLQHLAQAMERAGDAHEKEQTPPGIFTLLFRVLSADGRRGLSFATLLLQELGQATRQAGS